MSNLSPAPGTPQTGTKAYLATGLTVVVAFVLLWVADKDPFTAKEAASAAVQALIGGGVVGVPTYLARNKPTA
jgi:uncharacterized membrane protein YedE/YeeE